MTTWKAVRPAALDYERAAAYVVEQAKADGLQPAGVNGFYQPVKFRSQQIDESQSSIALVRDGKLEPMVLGDDAMFRLASISRPRSMRRSFSWATDFVFLKQL